MRTPTNLPFSPTVSAPTRFPSPASGFPDPYRNTSSLANTVHPVDLFAMFRLSKGAFPLPSNDLEKVLDGFRKVIAKEAGIHYADIDDVRAIPVDVDAQYILRAVLPAGSKISETALILGLQTLESLIAQRVLDIDVDGSAVVKDSRESTEVGEGDDNSSPAVVTISISLSLLGLFALYLFRRVFICSVVPKKEELRPEKTCHSKQQATSLHSDEECQFLDICQTAPAVPLPPPKSPPPGIGAPPLPPPQSPPPDWLLATQNQHNID